MTTWEKICRVCSSPAQYEVFAKIPTYLHATSNEFINWQKPVNILLEETTGVKVSPDDGLPKCICALCISYLKHASTFREQVIKNALSLQVVKKLREEKFANNTVSEKDSFLITEQDLHMSETRKVNTNILANTLQRNAQQKVTKEMFHPTLPAPSQDHIIQQMRYLNLLFDKDINAGIAEIERQDEEWSDTLPTNRPYVDPMEDYETESTSNEDNDTENILSTAMSKKDIFSYTEKNFEEDDIMNLEELREAININIPEDCKERKCRACFRRFMFEDSFQEHMDNCVEFKFLNFIEEINLLLEIRRKKAVSPHEFIRRMIFSLRKICEFLKINCEEILLPAELGITEINNETDNRQINDTKDKTELNNTELNQDNESKLHQQNQPSSPLNFIGVENKQQKNYNLAELLLGDPENSAGTTTPISIHNNILYEIERSQSRNAQTSKILDNNTDADLGFTNFDNSISNVKVMRPIPMHATAQVFQNEDNTSPVKYNEVERQTFLQKLERAVCQTPQQDPNHRPSMATPSISVRKDLMPKAAIIQPSPTTFSAACNTCNLVFDTISVFEIHNAMYHNDSGGRNCDEERERERIIAMFENEDDI